MYPGLLLRQDGRQVEPGAVPAGVSMTSEGRDVLLFDIEIDRENVGYDRNWRGFHRRRWDRNSDDYARFVLGCLEAEHGPAQAEAVLQLDSPTSKLKLVEAVARRIWEGDFENYSRFTGRKLIYKTGDETLRNIMDGAGGICSEKVQALKFITDHYGIKSEYLIAGPDVPGPVPEAQLREMLTTFDFRFSRRHMRYWQHAALLCNIDGETALVDVTNGNIPFVFERNEAAERLLGVRREAGHERQDGAEPGGLLLSQGLAGHTRRPLFRHGGLDTGRGPCTGLRQRAGPVHIQRIHGRPHRLQERADPGAAS